MAAFMDIDDEFEFPPYGFSTVMIRQDDIYAAARGQGLFRKPHNGSWTQDNRGLPNNFVVHRLQIIDDQVYVCTSKGLYYRGTSQWHAAGIAAPCYQALKAGGFFAATTEKGLWCRTGADWESIAYPDSTVYDLLYSPNYIILGTNDGLSLYDRFTGSWAEFPLDAAVSSMAVSCGYLVGATLGGELVQGNKKGGFAKFGFEGLHIRLLKQSGADVYACTNRGLYRLEWIGTRFVLRSFIGGCSIADMIATGNTMYIATDTMGIKKVKFRSGSEA